MFEMKLLWAALLAYVLCGSICIGGVVLRRRPERTVLALMLLGLVLHTWSIGLRWERLGHGPYITLFEILSSNVWSLTLVFAFVYWRLPVTRPSGAVVMPILFVLMAWMLVSSVDEGHLPATYHTIWLFVHIGFGKVFLGSVLVAVGLSGVILLRGTDHGRQWFERLADSEKLSELSFRFMVLGFIFESLMLVAGAIWAQDAWGRYWAWDPLETWAFLTWLLLVISLHLRVTYKLSAQYGAILVMLVFVLAFLTFFGVPFVSTSPHKGAV